MSRKKQTTVTIPANKIGQESLSERSAELNLEASLGESRPLSADVIEFRVFGYAHNDITDPPGWTPPFDVDTSKPCYWLVKANRLVCQCGRRHTQQQLREAKCSQIQHYRIRKDKFGVHFCEPVTLYVVRRKWTCPTCGKRIWDDCSSLAENGSKMSRMLERLLTEKAFYTDYSSLGKAYGVSKNTIKRLFDREVAMRDVSRTWSAPAVLGIYTVEVGREKWGLCIDWDDKTLLDIVDFQQEDGGIKHFIGNLLQTERLKLILTSADEAALTVQYSFPPEASVRDDIAIEKEDVLYKLQLLIHAAYDDAVKHGIPRRQALKDALLDENDCTVSEQDVLCEILSQCPGLALAYEYHRNAKHFYKVTENPDAFYDTWWLKATDEWLPNAQNDNRISRELLERIQSFAFMLHDARKPLVTYLNVHIQNPELLPESQQVQQLLQGIRGPLAQYKATSNGKTSHRTNRKNARGAKPSTLRNKLLYGLPQRIAWLNAEERKEATMAFCAPGQTPRRFYYNPAHPEIPLEYFLYTLPLFLNELDEGIDYRMPLPYETPEMTEL